MFTNPLSELTDYGLGSSQRWDLILEGVSCKVYNSVPLVHACSYVPCIGFESAPSLFCPQVYLCLGIVVVDVVIAALWFDSSPIRVSIRIHSA